MFMVIVSEILLYLCVSLLIGSFLIALVPSSFRPAVNIPRSVQITATIGIAVFSFAPVLVLIIYLYENMGLSETLQTVLLTFEVGKAWIFTFLVVNVLFIFIVWFDDRNKPIYSYIGIIFVVILIMGIGWASHASSIDHVKGFLTHTSHFIAVSIWVGILLVVSWFSKDHSNWLNFLKWFSPVAIICFSITIVSGLILMTFVVEFNEYANAWMLPYGQLLLLKHLTIIPLLVYAGINSVLIRKKLLKDHDFNPIPWTRVESILILVVFSTSLEYSFFSICIQTFKFPLSGYDSSYCLCSSNNIIPSLVKRATLIENLSFTLKTLSKYPLFSNKKIKLSNSLSFTP